MLIEAYTQAGIEVESIENQIGLQESKVRLGMESGKLVISLPGEKK